MKREDLISWGLTDEQVKKVNAETQLASVLANMLTTDAVAQYQVDVSADTTDAVNQINAIQNSVDEVKVPVSAETQALTAAFDQITSKASEIQGRGIYGDEAMIAAAGEFSTYFTDADAITTMMDTLADYAMGMSTLITFKAGDKTPITKNFTRNEFQCSCGCSAQMVDEMLVQKLQTIRTVYDTPLKITSGYRCVKHNAAVGGAKSSKHLYGIAADVKDPTGKLNPVALAILASNTFGGVGVYWYGTAAFVHVDVRKTKATWLCTQKGVYNYTSHHTFIMPTVRRGSSTQTEKSAIKMLQRLLGLPVDGIFGKNTENAVRAAQKAHNLAVDGIVGKNTWCAIAGVE